MLFSTFEELARFAHSYRSLQPNFQEGRVRVAENAIPHLRRYLESTKLQNVEYRLGLPRARPVG